MLPDAEPTVNDRFDKVDARLEAITACLEDMAVRSDARFDAIALRLRIWPCQSATPKMIL